MAPEPTEPGTHSSRSQGSQSIQERSGGSQASTNRQILPFGSQRAPLDQNSCRSSKPHTCFFSVLCDLLEHGACSLRKLPFSPSLLGCASAPFPTTAAAGMACLAVQQLHFPPHNWGAQRRRHHSRVPRAGAAAEGPGGDEGGMRSSTSVVYSQTQGEVAAPCAPALCCRGAPVQLTACPCTLPSS